MKTMQRPRLRGYAAVFALWALVWSAYIMSGYYRIWSQTGIEEPGMGRNILWGLLGGALVIGLAYAMAAKERRVEEASAQPSAAVLPEPEARPDVLELRGVGLRVDVWGNAQVWDLLKEQDHAYKSVLSQDAADYPIAASLINDKATRALTSAFKYSAGHGVERWPIPVIIFGPVDLTDEGLDQESVAGHITSNRQGASLGVHTFTWIRADHVTNPQAQIDYLFAFFENNPEAPEVLIYGMDGLSIRSWFGGEKVPEGQHVPAQFDAVAGLLVARTDRVDRYMRPYVSADPPGAGMNDKNYDSIKLWNFFWDARDAYDRQYEHALEANKDYDGPVIGPGMPPTDWWRAQLPKLWPTLSNKGPGGFVPNEWFPVRWAKWQLEEFDQAPRLGGLHRPVSVDLKDAEGQALPRAAQAAALQAGWQQLIEDLPEGERVVRVFYDGLNQPGVLPLLQQLEDAGAPDPTAIQQGFDLGHRLGNLGMMAPMVGLSLSSFASTGSGGASVTANLTADGKLHLMLVTPPALDTWRPK